MYITLKLRFTNNSYYLQVSLQSLSISMQQLLLCLNRCVFFQARSSFHLSSVELRHCYGHVIGSLVCCDVESVNIECDLLVKVDGYYNLIFTPVGSCSQHISVLILMECIWISWFLPIRRMYVSFDSLQSYIVVNVDNQSAVT